MRKPGTYITSVLAQSLLLVHLMATGDLSAAQSDRSVGLSFDVVRFRGDSDRVYVELAYAFQEGALRYVQFDSLFQGGILLTCIVMKGESTLVNQTWRVPHTIHDTAAVVHSDRSLVGLLRFLLDPGSYRVHLAAIDVNDHARKDSISFTLFVPVYRTDSPTMSDLELCSSIREAPPDERSTFYKNTFEVIPNPGATFGNKLPYLYYYLELYGLQHLAAATYSVTASVLDATDRIVFKHQRRKVRNLHSTVEVGVFDVSSLRSGVYVLKIVLSDSVHGELAEAQRKFFVYNPSIELADTSARESTKEYLASEYGVMGENDMDQEFAIDRYIATGDEVKKYSELHSVDAKREFLYFFWKKRDPDPSTSVNEAKQEFMARVRYANDQFSSGMKSGWKTDRGRVYIMYGKPDEIERHPNESGVKPYEIWYYHGIQGGVEFVFIDKTGFADYMLVHSTHRNELHDEDWQRLLGYP